MDYRIEKDSMGEVRVPKDALYGAQTQRAVENFPISGYAFPRVFIRALGLIKAAAARVNLDLGLLDAKKAAAIARASEGSSQRRREHVPVEQRRDPHRNPCRRGVGSERQSAPRPGPFAHNP